MILASKRSLSTCESRGVNPSLALTRVLSYCGSAFVVSKNLRRSPNSLYSVFLLPIPFVSNCMMVQIFPSETCVGIDGGSGFGVNGVGAELMPSPQFIGTLLRLED